MELGIALPTQGRHASPETIGGVAEEAERIGLGSVWTGERLVRPTQEIPMGGAGGPMMAPPDFWSTVYDPLETLTFVAGRTSRIRLGTSVLCSLYHSPLVLARRLASLDHFSGGDRLLIGVGQGWMSLEFAAVNVPERRRGAGFEEHVQAMRAAWGPDPVRFDGRFYQIPESQVGPKPVGDLPLLAGAGSPAGIERGVRQGMGLTSVLMDWDMFRGGVTVFREAERAAGHEAGTLPLVAHINGPITAKPLDQRMPGTGSLEQVAADLDDLEALGVDHVFWLWPDADPAEQLQFLEQLHTHRETRS